MIRTRIVVGSGPACLATVGVALAATRSAEQGVVDLPETEVGDRLEIRFDLESRDDVSAVPCPEPRFGEVLDLGETDRASSPAAHRRV